VKLTRKLSWLVAVAAVLSIPVAAMGDGPAWWDPLNVAGTDKSAKKTTARKPAAKESSWAKLPGFGSDSKTAKKPAGKKEPSTLTKMNNSTKSFFNKTADVLTPWDNNKKKPISKQPTGYGTGGGAKTTAKAKKEEPKGNILTSWWKDKEPEPKRPKTVSDFIAGERPYAE
jgi:hypothetical protein